MLEGKGVIEDTDMPVKMQIQAMRWASQALDVYDVLDYTSIAAHIKKVLISVFQLNWGTNLECLNCLGNVICLIIMCRVWLFYIRWENELFPSYDIEQFSSHPELAFRIELRQRYIFLACKRIWRCFQCNSLMYLLSKRFFTQLRLKKESNHTWGKLRQSYNRLRCECKASVLWHMWKNI